MRDSTIVVIVNVMFANNVSKINKQTGKEWCTSVVEC